MPKKALGKEENQKGEGARGVVLFPGDLIQFGASTRIYALDGPREFDRGAMKASQQQALMLKNQQVKKISGEEVETLQSGDNHDMSWGINFDDADNDEDSTIQSNSRLAVDIADIPSKHRKIYENIEAKKYKLANMQLEMQRIQSKASSSDLTSGQTKQLESLELREKNVLQEISELETTLRDKMNSSGSQSLAKRGRHVDEDDVDDFFDRTSHKRSKMVEVQESAAETEASLMERCKMLFVRWKADTAKVENLTIKVDDLQYRLVTIYSTEQDDEESFFVKNDLDLVLEEYNTAVSSVQSVAGEIDEVEKLLRIVNDKVIVDRNMAFVGDLSKHKSLVESRNEEVVGDTVTVSNDIMAMPPPRTMPEVRPTEMAQIMMPPPLPSMSARRSPMPPPTVKVSQRSKPAVTDLKAPQSSTDKLIPSGNKVRGPDRPPQGTLSFLSSTDGKKNVMQKSGEKAPKKHILPPNNSATAFDSKKDTWVAPKGQDGSGITKLNAKFHGRY